MFSSKGSITVISQSPDDARYASINFSTLSLESEKNEVPSSTASYITDKPRFRHMKDEDRTSRCLLGYFPCEESPDLCGMLYTVIMVVEFRRGQFYLHIYFPHVYGYSY